MTAALFALAFAALVGLPPSLRSGRTKGWAFVAGSSILTGGGVIAISMLALSFAAVPWSLVSVIPAAALVSLAATLVVAGSGDTSTPPAVMGSAERRERWFVIALDLFLIALVAGQVGYVTAAAPWEWDFTGIWGLKGAMFTHAGGVDLTALKDPALGYSHPDYPPLVPLLFSWIAICGGGWTGNGLALIGSVYGVAALLVVRVHLASRLMRSLFVALGSLALVRPLLDTPVGLADGVLLALITVAVLEIASFDETRGEAPVMPWLWLGFAALTKNEGMAAIVSVVAAVLIVRRGRLRRHEMRGVLVASSVAMTWIIPRAIAGLETDLASGGPLHRIATNLAPLVSSLLVIAPAHPVQWVLVVLALLLSWRMIGRDRVILMFLAFQSFFYLGAYLVTPHDVAWHVGTSWPRLTMHLLPLAVVVALTALLRTFSRDPVPGLGATSVTRNG